MDTVGHISSYGAHKMKHWTYGIPRSIGEVILRIDEPRDNAYSCILLRRPPEECELMSKKDCWGLLDICWAETWKYALTRVKWFAEQELQQTLASNVWRHENADAATASLFVVLAMGCLDGSLEIPVSYKEDNKIAFGGFDVPTYLSSYYPDPQAWM